MNELKCPVCGAELDHMLEYDYTSPNHYDGASEAVYKCGHRIGRWSGKVLKPGEEEKRFNKQS